MFSVLKSFSQANNRNICNEISGVISLLCSQSFNEIYGAIYLLCSQSFNEISGVISLLCSQSFNQNTIFIHSYSNIITILKGEPLSDDLFHTRKSTGTERSLRNYTIILLIHSHDPWKSH